MAGPGAGGGVGLERQERRRRRHLRHPDADHAAGNYHQISTKPVSISGTIDAVDKAGREKETAYQKVLKAKELRRDIEKTLLAAGRSGSDPRKAATLYAWITNVDDNGATNATGDGTDFNGQTTSGTARAWRSPISTT